MKRNGSNFKFHHTVTLFIALVLGAALLALPALTAMAESLAEDFETFATGTPNGQGGWASSGSAAATCSGNTLDHAIVDNIYGYTTFGLRSLRISNAVTCGSFGNQTFSKLLTDEVGETNAYAASPSGTRQRYFVAQWDFASTVPSAQQTGLSVVASPDTGDGGRMSWVQMTDTPTGLEVNFYDYQDVAPFGTTTTPADGRVLNQDTFVLTNLASGLDRTIPHTIKIEVITLDGPRNDVVKVYVNGTLRHTGTSWEDYFRWMQGPGQPEQTALVFESRTMRSILFRTSGTAVPSTLGNGFLIDNFSISSGPVSQCTTDCYVDAVNGNDALGGTNPTTDAKKTIQAAISQVSASGTVHVAAGTYAENVNINKTLTLNGPNQGVAGSSLSRVAEATVTSLNVGAANVTIDGFAIAEGAVVEGSPSGIYVKSFPNVTIRNNKLTRTGSYASYRGIQTVTSPSLANLTIEDNFATGWATGAYLNPQVSGVISGNVFESNFVGMSFDNPDGILVINNKFLNNGFEGVGIGDVGGGKPVNVTFWFNVFSGNAAGLGNYSSIVVNAINNWWGDASGPSGEGSGTGDSVSTNVDFTPWLGATLDVIAFAELAPTETLNGPSSSTATNNGPGSYFVALSQFSGNPSNVANFSGAGTFFDVFVSGATASDSLTVVLPAVGNKALYYYNGTAWLPVKVGGNKVFPSGGTYTFVLNNTSEPKLIDLNGTPFTGAGNEEIRITPSATTVSAGQTFQVVVDAGSDALFGVDVRMAFSAAQLEVTSIALGNGLQPGTIAVNTYNNGAGTLQFAYSQLGSSENNVSGTNLTLATITFLAKAAGNPSISLGAVLFTNRDGNPTVPAPLDSPINLTVNPSPSVYVDVALQGRSDHAGLQLQVSPVGPGNVLYDNSVVAGKLEIPTVPSGSYEARVSAPKYLAAVQTFTVSTQSVYDLNAIGGAPASMLTLALRGGDINGDDQINIQDLVLIGVNFGSTTVLTADINGDGVVNIQDLAIAAGNFGLKTGVIDYPDYPNDLWN